MKKLLITFLLLLPTLIIADKLTHVNIDYHENDDYYTMNISGEFSSPIQIFLDLDNNKNTGYTKGKIIGADTLIEIGDFQTKSNQIYNYQGEGDNWSWNKSYKLSSSNIWIEEHTLHLTLDRYYLNMQEEAQNDIFNYRILALNNNWNKVLASYPIKEAMSNYGTLHISSEKDNYLVGEKVWIELKHKPNNKKDWIGIYRTGTNNDNHNVVAWVWAKNINKERIAKGDWYDFSSLKAGEYEARFFLNNSYNLKESIKFSISNHKKKLIYTAGGSRGYTPINIKLLSQPQRAQYINNLPFDGFVIYGDSYSAQVMKSQPLEYTTISNNLKAIKDLYPSKKENFLLIRLDFPGDLWDTTQWNQVTQNFKSIAKIANDLGFKGIALDDEPYSTNAQKMINFKFLEQEKEHIPPILIDQREGYRNPLYNFKKHMTQVESRFKTIMKNMIESYPNITTLVYHGPKGSHYGVTKDNNKIWKNVLCGTEALPRESEFRGAIFLGLKQGISKGATLHDMGEKYRYRKESHFADAYQWRKFDIASDFYNNLNKQWQWVIPKEDRENWKDDVHVGFMVTDHEKGCKENEITCQEGEWDTTDKTTPEDIKKTIELAGNHSDKYVIFYTEKIDWTLNDSDHSVTKSPNWEKAISEAYHNLK